MVRHADKNPAAEHVRRCNGPTSSEVAAIVSGPEKGWVSDRYTILRRRDVLWYMKNEGLYKASISYRSYHSLLCVLLYLCGGDSWHFCIAPWTKKINREEKGRKARVTLMIFYPYELFQNSNPFNTLLQGGRLCQLYVVDQYCKVKAERLEWTRKNQETLCAANFTTIQNVLADAEKEGNGYDSFKAGRFFVLPQSYIGGDKYMRLKIHDIIAVSERGTRFATLVNRIVRSEPEVLRF